MPIYTGLTCPSAAASDYCSCWRLPLCCWVQGQHEINLSARALPAKGRVIMGPWFPGLEHDSLVAHKPRGCHQGTNHQRQQRSSKAGASHISSSVRGINFRPFDLKPSDIWLLDNVLHPICEIEIELADDRKPLHPEVSKMPGSSCVKQSSG